MIRNCEVYGSITDNNYVGGVAAVNLGLIQNCRNYAEVDSLETGETWEYEDWMSGYGAGGIAGLCATSRDVEGILPVCAVIDCYNYADVTAMSYAGGIVAYLDDRTNGQAPASSVQELVQSSDFVMPSEQAQDSELSEMTAEEGGALFLSALPQLWDRYGKKHERPQNVVEYTGSGNLRGSELGRYFRVRKSGGSPV